MSMPHRKKPLSDRAETMLGLRAAGLSHERIGALFGASHHRVRQMCKAGS